MGFEPRPGVLDVPSSKGGSSRRREDGAQFEQVLLQNVLAGSRLPGRVS
jgi:hypothetical protein